MGVGGRHRRESVSAVTGCLLDHLASHGDRRGRRHRRPPAHLSRTGRRDCRIRRRARHPATARPARDPQRPAPPWSATSAHSPAGHVALPLPAGSDHSAVIDTYDPDVVVRDGVVEHRHGASHDLHPDLALLLSTSGSTGSPKLVRLSRANLIANAESIAQYLDITANRPCRNDIADVVLLRTIGDSQSPAAWRRAHPDRTLGGRHRVLGVVAPPPRYHVRRCSAHLRPARPHRLRRHVTPPSALRHAGGRPARARIGCARFAELGRRQGWQLFVMYGATEATARMAYLPAELVLDNPGRASAGPSPVARSTSNRSTIRRRLPSDTGELVYRGPNVMMGYAREPADLALGRTVDALRTGDIAADASERAVRSRRAQKPFRQDVRPAHRPAASRGRPCGNAGVTAICTDDDGVLLVAAAQLTRRRATCGDAAASAAGSAARGRAGRATWPRSRCCRRENPTTKPSATSRAAPASPGNGLDLRRLFADVLQIDPANDRARAQLRRPRRQLAVLRDDVGAPGTRARSPARRLAATHAARTRGGAPAGPAVVGCDAGDQRRAARDRDRPRRRLARRAVRSCGAARTSCWASSDTTSAASA